MGIVCSLYDEPSALLGDYQMLWLTNAGWVKLG